MEQFLDINGQYEYFKAINVYLNGDLAVNDGSTSILLETLNTSIDQGNELMTEMLFNMLLQTQQVNNSNDTTNQLLTNLLNKNNTIDLTPLIEAVNNNKVDLTPVVEAINNIQPPEIIVQNDLLVADLKRWTNMMYKTTVKSVLLADEFNKEHNKVPNKVPNEVCKTPSKTKEINIVLIDDKKNTPIEKCEEHKPKSCIDKSDFINNRIKKLKCGEIIVPKKKKYNRW